MPGPIVIVGDCLLDVDVEGQVERLCPEAAAPVVDVRSRHRRPGGAGLAALLAATGGAEIVLVTALGEDASGRHVRELLPAGVETVGLPLLGTTVRKTRVRVGGRTLVRIDSGDGRACAAGGGGGRAGGALPGRLAGVLRGARVILVSDYGRGVAEVCRPLLSGLAAPLVWDPHPRGARPVPRCALVTPNEAEAGRLCGRPYGAAERAARTLIGALDADAVAVTLGERGAVLACGAGRCVRVPPPEVAVGRDPCGAGDRFAVTAALALAEGAGVEEAVAAAVGEAARFVSRGGAAAIRPVVQGAGRSPVLAPRVPCPAASASALRGTAEDTTEDTAEELAALVRGSGGRLIATGGCFDLLHAGHVSLLRRARALGDALIVCLNADASVRRLKGPGRPVVAQRDRIEVLRALECVDAVAVFQESTPCALIDRLRPHVWVKGGDYAREDLPEAQAVRRAGGEVVILSTVPGRSTTGLIAAVRAQR